MVQVFVKEQEQDADCISSTSPHSLSFSIVHPINSKPKIRQYHTQERNAFSVRAHARTIPLIELSMRAPMELDKRQLQLVDCSIPISFLHNGPVPTVYWRMSAPMPDPSYLIRTRGESLAMANAIRRRIHELEPARSVFGIRPLTDHLSDSFAEDCLRTIPLSFFGMTAISLACLSLYGTLNYFVTIRRREIGVRLALGALRQQIASRFLLEGLCIAAVGCASGLLIAAAASRLFSGMLYGFSSMDAVTFSGVAAILLVFAALSTLIPATQAARTDPMQVLREE
jgi:hypothetical protein